MYPDTDVCVMSMKELKYYNILELSVSKFEKKMLNEYAFI